MLVNQMCHTIVELLPENEPTVIVTTNMVLEKLNVKTLKLPLSIRTGFFVVQFKIFLEIFSGLVMLNFLAYSIG